MVDSERVYPVMEHFYTLQGEGFWTGTPAYFIRLAGCDVGCHWCDVKESWDSSLHPQLTISQLLSAIQLTRANRVVITGGEPLLHSLEPLCQAFKKQNLLIHIETSGSHSLSGFFDWFCLSPKKFKPALPDAYQKADELK
ncbi:MAG: 7-carboxy-7-deazaguanine synthase QueE, partial [Bacteroidia bacterium]|nr:7-carboxy-7-deazaguanine synthase QueE [Bacteroidia bacterium]